MLNNKIIKKIYNEGKKVVKMNPYGNKKIFTKENKNEVWEVTYQHDMNENHLIFIDWYSIVSEDTIEKIVPLCLFLKDIKQMSFKEFKERLSECFYQTFELTF